MSDVNGTAPSGSVHPPIDQACPPATAGPVDVTGLPPTGLPPAGSPGAGQSTGGLKRLVGVFDVLRTTGGLGLDDLRHTGCAELGRLVEGLRRSGQALRRLRRHPAWSGDLIWRLAGIIVTALLSCLLDSPVTRACAQAAAIAALTIALSWNGKDPDPRIPLQRANDAAGCATSEAGCLPSAGAATAIPPGTAPPIPPDDVMRLIPPEAARLIPPDAGHGSVVLCRVIPTPTQFLLVVTVVDLPPGAGMSR